MIIVKKVKLPQLFFDNDIRLVEEINERDPEFAKELGMALNKFAKEISKVSSKHGLPLGFSLNFKLLGE